MMMWSMITRLRRVILIRSKIDFFDRLWYNFNMSFVERRGVQCQLIILQSTE